MKLASINDGLDPESHRSVSQRGIQQSKAALRARRACRCVHSNLFADAMTIVPAGAGQDPPQALANVAPIGMHRQFRRHAARRGDIFDRSSAAVYKA